MLTLLYGCSQSNNSLVLDDEQVLIVVDDYTDSLLSNDWDNYDTLCDNVKEHHKTFSGFKNTMNNAFFAWENYNIDRSIINVHQGIIIGNKTFIILEYEMCQSNFCGIKYKTFNLTKNVNGWCLDDSYDID